MIQQVQSAPLIRQQNIVKVYDIDLMRQGVIDVYRSLIWTRKYKEAGTVELHAALNSRNLALLQEGHIVTMTGSVESAIIEGIAADDYSNEITATGHMLSSGLSRRGIKTIVNVSNETFEDVMRKLVDVSAINSQKPLPRLALGERKGIGEKVTLQVSYKDLYTYLMKLSACSNLGFRIRGDYKAKQFYFEVYEGKDHSVNQTGNKRVIFSEVYRNINKATYTSNSQNYKTHAIVFGDGEGAVRTVMEATIDSTATGWERRELMVDARDIQRDNLTTAQYQSALIQRGNEKLAEYGIVECLEAVTLPNVNFTYKTDYDLGDIVTVNKKAWGIKMDKRITEVQEIYENGGLSVVPTFGDPLPDIVDLSNN
ncbi:siphovirus ReqiPepy6 Gp37-like family protein [Parablautia intestinalis]|uniref:siphovirus ReqiPepy6 Gp37-like family protein n=1 Tax=Parablautia intestinalis TaxID=2320100 RepID=UPI00259CE491|nr:siphovirus ReqiPepy6 Gp37-like family protein [Parablautia intestinalis]